MEIASKKEHHTSLSASFLIDVVHSFSEGLDTEPDPDFTEKER
jgi:hypothetical protein